MDEVYSLSQKMIELESNAGHRSAMSIVVSMELISRLGKDDPAKERCFKALCLQYFHHRRRTPNGFEGSYYPPLNVILSQFFFNKNSKYHDLYGKVLSLVINLTETLDITRCDEHAEQIEKIKKLILFENQEFQGNVEDLLKSLNSGKLDWEYFKKNEEERKQFIAKIDDGRVETLLGLGLFKRAHQVVELYGFSNSAAEKLQAFFDTYRPALRINTNILRSLAEGSSWLADAGDDKWNTLNDLQIMFGLLYERPGLDKKLVTDDRKIKNACVATGQGHLVISLDEYKKIIGL